MCGMSIWLIDYIHTNRHSHVTHTLSHTHKRIHTHTNRLYRIIHTRIHQSCTHAWVWHDSFTRVAWLIHKWGVWMRHDIFRCAIYLSVTWHFAPWLIQMCDITHLYALCDSAARKCVPTQEQCCGVLQLLQIVAVCCSVLHCVAAYVWHDSTARKGVPVR